MATLYFAHHAMYGRFGVEKNRNLSARAQVLADRLSVLRATHAAYTRDVALLRGAPHPDIVEESARRVLGWAYPRDRLLVLTR